MYTVADATVVGELARSRDGDLVIGESVVGRGRRPMLATAMKRVAVVSQWLSRCTTTQTVGSAPDLGIVVCPLTNICIVPMYCTVPTSGSPMRSTSPGHVSSTPSS
jgi:hypothetical protein